MRLVLLCITQIAGTLVGPAAHASSSPGAPQPAVAQHARGQLEGAELRARLEGDAAAADVRILYRLRVPAGAADVPLAALLFAGTRIHDASAAMAGRPLPLALEPRGRRLAGSLRLPAELRGHVAVVEIRYRVSLGSGTAAGPARIRIPVLAVLWPPAEAVPGAFRAEVALPPGLAARVVFPAVPAAPGPPHRLELPVLPAVLALDVAPGAAPFALLAATLDAGIVVLLAAFVAFGWRHLRRRSAA